MLRTTAATKATDVAPGVVIESSVDAPYEYRAYGAHLTSSLRFPELGAPADSPAAKWSLEVSDAEPPPLEGALLLGESEYAGGVRISLSRNNSAWQLRTSDAGTWLFQPHEGRMVWYRDPGVGDARGRYDALGRVMPLMLHATGALSLHGSSVATASGGIALLGPKGRGKSTLALACVAAGAALAGDDVAVLRTGHPPTLYPATSFARLHTDSAASLGLNEGASGTWGREKMLVPAATVARHLADAVPLRAIYLLEAAPEEAPQVVRRERVTGAGATVAMLSQATNALLLGGDEQVKLMQRVSELLPAVPLYVLHVPRNLSMLNECAGRLLGWLDEDASPALPHDEPAVQQAVSRRDDNEPAGSEAHGINVPHR